jgi:acyl dehydratase
VKIEVGQVATTRRTLVQSDFDRFAALSGDDNPIHVDASFAARTRFGQTVAHGMLLYSLVCSVLGTQLPGPGMIQVEQELMFPSATLVGEEVEIRLEVTAIQPGSGLVDIETLVIRPDGTPGLHGQTRVAMVNSQMYNGQAHSLSVPAASDSVTLRGMKLGQRARMERTFSADDLADYSELTGDTNPMFADTGYVRRLGLERLTLPGGLLGGLFSTLLGTELPGHGTNYLKQRLVFPTLAYVDDPLTAVVEIVRLRPEKELVNLRTTCTDRGGRILCDGEALVLVSDVGL